MSDFNEVFDDLGAEHQVRFATHSSDDPKQLPVNQIYNEFEIQWKTQYKI